MSKYEFERLNVEQRKKDCLLLPIRATPPPDQFASWILPLPLPENWIVIFMI